MEKKIKKCAICGKDILMEIEHYVRVTDYRNGIFYIEFFYHNKCYLDRINKGSTMQQMAMKMLKRTNKLLDQAGIDDDEEKEEFHIIA